MKVIIQIPCWNEAESLPKTLAELPTRLDGVDTVELLVVDDGSTDGTPEVATALGVHHVVRQLVHTGLARTFLVGLRESMRRGADIVVNTDADNQYCAADIPKLVEPILAGRADYVIGDRDVESLAHFSRFKKGLQRLGSAVVRSASRTEVRDATSGFRAFSRRAALQLHVHSAYTYTHETLIQAGEKRIALASVPVRVNRVVRPSRLFRSIPRYVARSVATIARIYLVYNAFRVFLRLALATLLIAAGALVSHRLLDGGNTALWVSAGAFGLTVLFAVAAAFADLIDVNRRLQEEAVALLREVAWKDGLPDRGA